MITGVSGSGKSTLAFDIIFNEGQRRYLESLNAYARQFVQPAARPDVDAIYGIPPTVAIEQRTSRGGRKSTVATLTEIYHFLRLLYVRSSARSSARPATWPSSRRPPPVHRRAPAEAAQGLAHPAAGAAGGGAQGLLHRARQVGQRARLQAAARRRRDADHLPVAAPQPLQGTHHRAAGGADPSCRRTTPMTALERNVIKALDLGKGLVHVLDLDRAKKPKVQVFSIKRACPSCGTQLRRARSAPVLVQLQARLVRGLLRHRPRSSRASTRNRAARKSPGTNGCEGEAHELRDLRRPTAESRSRCTCASATQTSPSSRAAPSTTPSRSSTS